MSSHGASERFDAQNGIVMAATTSRQGLPMQKKRDMMSLSHQELEQLMDELGQPRFRVRQIEEWLYARGAKIISNLDNLPLSLRSQLDARFFIGSLDLVTRQVSEDGTRKYLFELSDGACIETVGIPSADGKRLTVCFSSQAGCPMGCAFCATGRAGFVRNLSSGEMYDQVRLVSDDFGIRVSNVVCMGQGEPFLNYDEVLEALRRMNAKLGLGIGARHMTVSTCGLLDGIERFSTESEQFTLAISLHAAIQDTRDSLMPGVSNISIDNLKKAIRHYGEVTGRRPSLEYAPIKGVNDDDEHIEALVEFCKGMLCHVNLIPLNPVTPGKHGDGMMVPSNRTSHISNVLSARGIENSIRKSRGKDIDGACGQLRQRLESSMSS